MGEVRDPAKRCYSGRSNYFACRGDVMIIWDNTNDANPNRGAFVYGVYGGAREQQNGIASLIDGTSNTVILSESCISRDRHTNVDDGDPRYLCGIVWDNSLQAPADAKPSDCAAYRGQNGLIRTMQPPNPAASNAKGFGAVGKGSQWADSRAGYSNFMTILPPNAPSCNGNQNAAKNPEGRVFVSASSNHSGGANAAMGDGSVRFVSESVEAGDPTIPTPHNHTGPSHYGVWGALGTRDGGESKSL